MNFSHSRAGAAATYEAAAPTLAPQGTGHGEFVLATPSPGRIDERARLRRITLQLSGAALVATLIVAVAGSLVSRHIAEQQAVHDVAQTTDLIADTAVQPALTDSMATSSVATRAGLDRLVREHILSDQVVRVKLWNATGSVLYSDEPRLVDQRFTLEDTAVKALTTPQTVADVSDLTRPENQYERGQGKLLEVYRPVWTPAGTPLLFEAYFRYQIVSDRSAQLWRGFSGVMLSTLAALVLLLIPLAWLVHAKSRAARTRHDELQRRALEASEDERRRIAATLHDGVVQDLAAIAFATAGQARQASARGEGVDAGQLQSVAASVRDSIADLRNLMTDIYPASLHTSGLAAALGDLATSNTGAPRILLDLNEDAIARLTT
ncbi:MAG TPA: histidine kinase, partial [Jatrophihabitantaceae bacterium]|nr:histidine kinase [Jatrophihabitantaceae bacterium]